MSVLQINSEMSAIGQRNCNLTSCDISLSYYHYRPSLAANGFFLFLFCVCLTLLLLHTFLSRTFLGFNITLLYGTILEIIGYTCRVTGSHEPFIEVCPAFVDPPKNSSETNYERTESLRCSIRLLNDRTGLHCCWYLLLHFAHRPYFRRGPLPPQSQTISSHFYRLRCRSYPLAGR